MITFADLFAGIGGFRLGIEQASDKLGIPVKCVFSSEIEKNAVKIYEKNFKETPSGDITKIHTDVITNMDLLCGGFPCQSFSIAGKRRGFDDTRGTLFFEIARIAEHKRPKMLFLENVKGLLNHDHGRTFGTILVALDELGYDVEWQCINSKDHGVPQNRERVFIIGHLRGGRTRQIFPIFGETGATNGEDSSTCIDSNYGKSIDNHGQRTAIMVSPVLTPDRLEKPPRILAKTIRCGGIGSPHGSKQNWDSYKIDGKIRRLTPVECERLQGYPDGYTEGIADSNRYKCLGNAVTVNVIEAIAEKILTELNK